MFILNEDIMEYLHFFHTGSGGGKNENKKLHIVKNLKEMMTSHRT